jgi:hypothetical protein
MATSTKKVTTPKKLPPNPFIHEIFEYVSTQRTVAKKVEALKEYRCDAVTTLLIWNFDDTEKNDVPIGTDHSSLRKEYRNLYHFVKGGNDSLSKTRRESMFIQILEVLHPTEANLLCLVKDKLLGNQYKITKGVVESAYPDIQWGGRS